MIEMRSYRLYTGTYGFTDPFLSYVRVLSVDREGTGYEVIKSGSVGNREALYDETLGNVSFRDPGVDLTDPAIPYDRTEIVNVIFKY